MAGPVNANSPPAPAVRPGATPSRATAAVPDPQVAAAFRDRLSQAATRHEPAPREERATDRDDQPATRRAPQEGRADEREARGDTGDSQDGTGGGATLAQPAAELAGARMHAADSVRGTGAMAADTLARMAAAIAEATPGTVVSPVTVAFPAQWGMGPGAVLTADAGGRVNLTLVGLPTAMTDGAAWAGVAATLRLALRVRDVRVGAIRHARGDDAPAPSSADSDPTPDAPQRQA